ncbi:hypothetical protein CHUAL_010554 [Chamberlinius hualienensis]
MEAKFNIIFAYFILVVGLCYSDNVESDGDLRQMILSLNLRLNRLETQREIDGKQLELMREKCDRTPSDNLKFFEKSLASLRTDVATLAANRERETGRLTDIRELRLELDSVHSDYSKIKVEVDGLKDRREEDLKIVNQQRNSQVTIKWLQKTIEELKREINELAGAHNVSVSIRQQQRVDNSLQLLKSDVIDLRKKLEEVRVTQDRTLATLTIAQQDVMDLQNQRHQTAANFQQFREEVSQLKDEILNSPRSPSRSLKPLKVGASLKGSNGSDPEKEDNVVEEEYDVKTTGAEILEYNKKENGLQFDHGELINDVTHHRLRHKGRALKEIEELRVVVSALQTKQKKTDHQLYKLKLNHTSVESNLHHMWGRMADLLNATRWRVAQHSALERQMDDLKDDLKRMDHNGIETTKTLHNLTDTVAGIDKLHSSTIQLFEALEGLEDEYSERIGDLHKEVSKFEFNMAQLSSTVNILKEDQSTQYTALKSTRSDISGLRQQIEDQNYRLASLRSQVLHNEANSLLAQHSNEVPNVIKSNFRLSRDEDQTSLMLDLESRVAEFDAKLLSQSKLINDTLDGMRSKADLDHVIHWAQSADKLDEMISNVSREVSPLIGRVTHLEHQLQEIYQQFPTDCSHVIGEKTGIYQIHPQGAQQPLTVLCDIDDNDNNNNNKWTVIQNRLLNSEADFNRNWAEYQSGFGKVSSNSDFWIGNDALHRLSRRGAILKVDLWDQNGAHRYATYNNFRIEDESKHYRLHVSGFEGNVSDAMSYHHGMKFSTRDNDHDRSDTVNCAEEYEGGWWYRNCQHANLNGKYSLGLTWFDQDNNTWLQLQRIQIKIKPKNSLNSTK